MFKQIPVDRKTAADLEQLGSKRKFWFRDLDKKRTLFKAEDRGTGEDWAEKIACELCKLLGIPHVHYELAIELETNTPGVVCETCAPRPMWLILGNQLLKTYDADYPIEQTRNYKFSQHTVTAVVTALGSLEKPSAEWTIACSLPAEFQLALDVFLGYVMLDALIANQDRHHENWAAIAGGSVLSLAPTFDHGASFARNLGDEERKDRLETKDRGRHILNFSAKARSAFYENVADNRPLGTFEAYNQFADIASDFAVQYWRGRLESLEITAVVDILEKVPISRMTRISKDFTLELIKVNRDRILRGQS